MSTPSRPPGSGRTMFPKTHVRRTPLTQEELADARAREADRKRWDPGYVTAEEARSIPQEVLDKNPVLRDRVKFSQPDWPENRMSATTALGPLKGGAGETTDRRDVPAESLFLKEE